MRPAHVTQVKPSAISHHTGTSSHRFTKQEIIGVARVIQTLSFCCAPLLSRSWHCIRMQRKAKQARLQECRQQLIFVLHSLDGQGELAWVALEDLMQPILQLCPVQTAVW